MMLVTEFYKNKEIFITGGTGYLGKSFIEKLLRSCPDVGKVYLLIREKRNKTLQERLNDFSNDLIFERLHREQPKAFEKIVPIAGDCVKLGLGINIDDLERLKNINIIIHGAANVRFDNDLHSSVLMNTRGTYELLKLALHFRKLIAFIHISTAYVNPLKFDVSEELCEAPFDWYSTIKIAETFDKETLETLKSKFSKFPNAYSLTKNLAEQVVVDFADKLPITILRPSIVIHSYKEPEPGYIDNLNGPMGMLFAVSIGLAQVTFCNKNLSLAIIPVDIVTILTIIAAYRRGLETINSKKCGVDIRNLTVGKLFDLNLYQSAGVMLRYVNEEPFEQSLWAPNIYFTSNYYLFIMCVFLINIPLALIYDTLLMFAKKEKMVMKQTRKFVFVLKVLGKFAQNYYSFKNEGLWELVKTVPHEERDKFDLSALLEVDDMDACFEHIRNGIKKYIYKQPLKSTPATQRRFKTLLFLDKILKIFVFFVVVMFLWRMFN